MAGPGQPNVERLTAMMRWSVEGDPYYGPSVLPLLDGISAERAAVRLPGLDRGIWQTVLHLRAEMEYAREACWTSLGRTPARPGRT